MPRQSLKCLSLTYMITTVLFSLLSKNFEIKHNFKWTHNKNSTKLTFLFFFKANFEFNKYYWVLLGNISYFLILSISNGYIQISLF